MRIKKGDMVMVISGDDKGRKGKVIKVMPKKQRVLVEGLNIQKKHQKPRREGEKGQIVEKPGPIHISNVKLICPRCGKATRVARKIIEGKKYRVCKKCGQTI
ncbi:50S ribosomal protein L24 [bacterium]|nr:50S ribosomal protein L24 [bacterium]